MNNSSEFRSPFQIHLKVAFEDPLFKLTLHLNQHYEFFCGILIVTVLTSVYSWRPYSPLDKRESRAKFMLMLFMSYGLDGIIGGAV